jgi:hypothetical protein
MEEILRRMKVIHASDALISEGIIPKRAKDLATMIDYDGVQSDPIVVTKQGKQYIVLDGMHRVAALKELECRDILVHMVNYEDENIILRSWDAIAKKERGLKDMILEFSSRRNTKIEKCSGDIRETTYKRNCYFGFKWVDGSTSVITEKTGSSPDLDGIINMLEDCEKLLDENGVRLTYLADTISDAAFKHTKDSALMIRPRFTKEEVVSRTLSSKLFPRKTTRHIIPNRPLKVNVKISLLSEDIDIEIKNRLLQAELKRLQDHGRIRFYPDSTYLFNE